MIKNILHLYLDMQGHDFKNCQILGIFQSRMISEYEYLILKILDSAL